MNIELELENECRYWDEQSADYCASGDLYRHDEFTNKTYRINCPECHGVGAVPTILGQTILDFVRKHQ